MFKRMNYFALGWWNS